MNYPESQIVQGVPTQAATLAGSGYLVIGGTVYRVDPVIEQLEAGTLDTVKAIRSMLRAGERPTVRIHFLAHPTEMIRGVGQPRVVEDVLYVTSIIVAGSCCGD